jgi:hypothetical protein
VELNLVQNQMLELNSGVFGTFFGTKTKTKTKSNPEKMMVVIGFFWSESTKNIMVENGLIQQSINE